MSIQTKLTLAGIITGLTGAAISAGKTGATMMHFKGAFDLSAQELQRWQYAALQFGVGAETVQSSIEGIQNAIASARTGGEFSDVFGKLGIDISGNKTAFDILKQIQERIKAGNTDAMRVFSSGLVSSELFQFLKRGPDMTKFKAPPGMILSDAQLRQQEKISVTFGNFTNNLKKNMDAFIVDNSKAIMDTIKALQDFLVGFMRFIKDHQKEINRFIVALEKLATALGDFIAKFAGGAAETISVASEAYKSKEKYGSTIAGAYATNQFFAQIGEFMVGILGKYAPTLENLKAQTALPQSALAPNLGRAPQSVSAGATTTQTNIYIDGVNVGDKLQETSRRDLVNAALQISRGVR